MMRGSNMNLSNLGLARRFGTCLALAAISAAAASVDFVKDVQTHFGAELRLLP